jgi:SAM-dependent methyltransferase
MYLNSYLLLKKYLVPWAYSPYRRGPKPGEPFYPGQPVSLLEVGAGKRFSKSVLYRLSQEQKWDYHPCDLKYHHSDVPNYIRMSGENSIDTPVSFDVVGCTQVIEHVRRPWIWVAELARVCKPGGLVVIVGPDTWGLHHNPYDCWRILPDGMHVLMEDAGLKVLVSRLEQLDPLSDPNPMHQMNLQQAAHWDTIAIGRKPYAA